MLHFQDYLRLLPDFEDVEAADKAKAQVLAYPNVSTALAFCLEWPDLLTAAQLIETLADELNGDNYSLLPRAANVLSQIGAKQGQVYRKIAQYLD